ncbi:MAG: glycosyltransferase family 39 protein [Polyangiaceae bacterium]|nr:glycosyltransferase family 39 protein [Polyangiaceae bacterium]
MSNRKDDLSVKYSWLVLCAAMVVHVALALPQAMLRRDIRHDEAITLTVATGHQAEYVDAIARETPPHLAWAPAKDWQRFLSMPADHPPELGVIARDLAHRDIHPPLYFWLLSLVARTFGTTLAVGLGLNVLLDCLTILATYVLGKRALRSERAAILAACLWAISPGPLEASLEMRQYALLGLLVPALAAIATYAFDSKSRFGPLHVGTVTILCALGILTHYHFLLLVSAIVLVGIVSLGEKYIARMQKRPVFDALARLLPFDASGVSPGARRNALAFALSSMVGLILGLAVHPFVSEIMRRQGIQAQSFKWQDIPVRIGGVMVGMGRFFVWSVPLIVVWMVVLVLAIVFAIRAPKGTLTNYMQTFDPQMRRLSLWLVLSFGAQAALFLAFRSPAGAMRAKYLALNYSLFACVLAGLLTHPSMPRHALRILAGVMCVSSIVALGTEVRRAWQIDASMPVVVSAPRIIVDTVARGSLPVALWNVPRDTLVFAATQNEILARREQVFWDLEPGTLVVVDRERGTQNGLTTMLEALSKRYRIEESRPAVFGDRIVYTIQERTPIEP